MKDTLNLNGKIVDLKVPKIMGILNATPDSFYKDSRINLGDESFLTKAEKMIAEGVDIIDIGGYSSRPGAENVSENIEIKRVLPIVKALITHFPDLPISVDTFRSQVAHACISEGAAMINDISGGTFDENMFQTILNHQVSYVLMHLRGDTHSFHKETNYSDLAFEVLQELLTKANSLRKKGLLDLILDPGIGFSKTLPENFRILKNVDSLSLNYPLLVGISRKSFIYKLLNASPEEVLPETTALHFYLCLKGVNILRVHDVKTVKNAIELSNALYHKII